MLPLPLEVARAELGSVGTEGDESATVVDVVDDNDEKSAVRVCRGAAGGSSKAWRDAVGGAAPGTASVGTEALLDLSELTRAADRSSADERAANTENEDEDTEAVGWAGGLGSFDCGSRGGRAEALALVLGTDVAPADAPNSRGSELVARLYSTTLR